MTEIDSFIGKFKHLWYSGSLLINSEAGKAKVTLSVELGDAPHPPAHSQQRSRNGPARQRRRVRREVAPDNDQAEEAEKAVKSDAEKAIDDQTNKNENLNAGKGNVEANMNVLDEVCCDDIYSKKATAMNENSDCDIYHFEFVDFTRESEAQDVINFFEEKIKNNFETFKVDKSDQIFKIDKIVTKRLGFDVEIKVKKDNVRVEESMKHIESFSGWPLQMKLKNISR